jgi:RHS repeat-associated protein
VQPSDCEKTPLSDATSLTPTDFTYGGTYQTVHPNGNYLHLGDFDGDQRADYLTLVSDASCYKIFISYNNSANRKEVTIPGGGTCTGGPWVNSDFMSVLDFDGDGKSEIMVVSESITKIYTFDNFSGTTINADKVYEAGYPTKWHNIFLGDFNGDRKTDLLTKNSTAGWNKAISKGKNSSNTFETTTFTFSQAIDLNTDVLELADFDGDGKTDILHWYANGTSASKLDLYYSQGNTFKAVSTYNRSSVVPLVGNTFRNYYGGDYNGDGKTDLLARYVYTQPIDLLYFFGNSKHMLLNKVANGFNHSTTFDYKSLAEGGSFYTKGSTATYPMADVQFPMYAASAMTVSNGNGGSNTTNYSYLHAKLHRKGRGFLGFFSTNATNLELNHRKETFSEFNTTFYIGMITSVTDHTITPVSWRSRTTYTNGVQSLSNGRYWQYVSLVGQFGIGGAQPGYVAYTYDAYGNITQAYATQYSINNDLVETSTTNYSYGTFCGWIPSRSTQTYISATRTGQTAYNKVTTRAYSATNGALTQEIEFADQTKKVTTSLGYDGFGNVTSESVAATGLTTRTTTFAYDTKGRFATAVTNPLSQTATAVYSPKWGKPTSQTSISNTTTSFTYDAFGREVSTTTPEGNTISTTYNWDVQGTNSIGGTTTVFRIENSIPGKPDVKTWYDVLGREKRKEVEGFAANAWVATTKTYDSQFRLATTTSPFYTGGSGIVTTYGYDNFDRQTTMSVNSTINTSIAYSMVNGIYTVTTTKPDATTASQVTDAAGKLISATDNGGTLTYEYNSAGNQTKVKNGTTTLVTMGYDVYGRQTSLADIDAGTTTYNYNAFGELASQTDANGNTHTMAYDVLGRITSRVGPASEGTTTYEYVTVNSGKNLIKKVTGFNGILQEYVYDTYSRMTQDKQTVDGTAHTTNYAYNNFGDVTSVTYPSSFAINNTYDAKGYLTHIKNGGNTTTLFQPSTYNAYGQITGYTLGNGIASTRSFDVYGFPTNFTATGKQNLNMSFNVQNGNLNSRNDVIKGRTETFAYDNLDRLTSATVTGQTANTVTYAAAGAHTGNIATKTSVGTYSYASNKIHAVASITNPNGTVPTGTQNVTYTAYHQPNVITEGIHKATFTYGPDYERRKMVIEQNNVVQSTRYYFGSYEKIDVAGTITHLHYIGSGAGLIAIVRKVGTAAETYNYTYTDHLGSILTLTDNTGTVVAEQNFDAWGRHRNPNDWTFNSVPTPPAWLIRGYTGHEHLPQFNLINMNGRVYDPILGRMLSVDDFVQDAIASNAYNRFSYASNNPLKYTDPDGEFVVPLIAAFLLFTDVGYDITKAVSPVAFHIDLNLGSHANGIGFDFSVGIPQLSPISYRYDIGATYYNNRPGGYGSGWQVRNGGEWGLGLGFIQYGGLRYRDYSMGRKVEDQVVHTAQIGTPLFNVSYSNDTEDSFPWADFVPLIPDLRNGQIPGFSSDRYRTASGRLRAGILELGFFLHTGEGSRISTTDGTRHFDGGDISHIMRSNGIAYWLMRGQGEI